MRLIGPLRRPLWLAAAVSEGALEVALSVVREARAALEEVAIEAQAPEPVRREAVRHRKPAARTPQREPRSPQPTRDEGPLREAEGTDGSAPARRPLPDEAKTLEDSPVRVAEFGEEGAEEDAGAEVRVEEPWEGYDGMTAAQVRRSIGDADREVLAAVALYEGFGKRRSSVIDAAERRLKRLSPPRP